MPGWCPNMLCLQRPIIYSMHHNIQRMGDWYVLLEFVFSAIHSTWSDMQYSVCDNAYLTSEMEFYKLQTFEHTSIGLYCHISILTVICEYLLEKDIVFICIEGNIIIWMYYLNKSWNDNLYFINSRYLCVTLSYIIFILTEFIG